jgi:hypothetical protein
MSGIIQANFDCPSDSSYHVDLRTMLPDGSPNATYADTIATGLCGCLEFSDMIEIDGNDIIFTIRIVDNEPIRGVELDVYSDFDGFEYSSLSKGEKLENVVDEDGNPRSMTLLGNWLEDHVKVLAYSTSRARTSGDGVIGDLLQIRYTLASGAIMPDEIGFYFTIANLPGTSADPELLNVSCEYPQVNNPSIINTSVASANSDKLIPTNFYLEQNYPNPFNPSTKISFDIPQSDNFVSLKIYDLLGKNIATIINKTRSVGRHEVEWNGMDALNNDAASGMYFYELRSGSFVSRKKMLLIR